MPRSTIVHIRRALAVVLAVSAALVVPDTRIASAAILFQADLAITKTDGVTTATPGGSVTYTITASNAGPDTANGATVTDTFPAVLTATWTCVGAGGGTCTAAGSGNINDIVNLPAGGSVTYTVSAAISASASGSLSNTARVTEPVGVTDPNPNNNEATDTDTLAAQADLAITKTDGVTTVSAGGSLSYTITATNAGPSNATGATVTDTFPASLTATWTCVGAGGGTCTASGNGNINDTVNLPAGGSVTYSVSASLDITATGSLSNTATVTAPQGVTDPNPGNNQATDTDTINAAPVSDLTLTKMLVGTIQAGSYATYTLTVTNLGPDAVTGAITVTDVLPEGLSFVSAGGTGWVCGHVAGTISCTTDDDLANGASKSLTVVALVAVTATGTIINGATVDASGTFVDSSPANGSAEASGTVLAPEIPQTGGESGRLVMWATALLALGLVTSLTAARRRAMAGRR